MRNITITALTAMVILAAASPCPAQEKAQWTKEIIIPIRLVSDTRQSSKFEEYRDVPNGLAIDLLDIGYKRLGYHFNAQGQNISRADQHLSFNGGMYGRFKFDLYYDAIPHRFAYDAKTMYDGVGTGNLVLKPGVRTTFAAGPNKATQGALVFNTIATPTDLYLTRKTTGLDLDIIANEELNVKIGYSRQHKKGTMPYAGAFFFGAAGDFELPAPIDYETKQFKLSADYAHKNMFLNAAYATSHFDNNIGTLTWENPLSAVDAPNTPSKGRLDLYPSNKSTNMTVSGGVTRLPWQSTISAVYSQGTMKQNDPFIPYTINTAISQPTMPAASLNGKVDTKLINLLATARPLPRVRLKARYRLYDYDNKTPSIIFPGEVVFDRGAATTVPLENEPQGFKTTTGTFVADWDVTKTTILTWQYKSELIRRTNAVANVIFVPKSIERGSTFTVAHKPNPIIDLRASYEHSKREGNGNYTIGVDPNMRVYDQGNRKQTRYKLMGSIYPSEQLSLTATLATSRFTYDNTFGLQSDKQENYGIDANYVWDNGANAYVFYDFEKYRLNQYRRAIPGSSYPEDIAPWSAYPEDRVNTIGLGYHGIITPRKLGWDVGYTVSKTNGSIVFSSSASPLPWDNVNDTKRTVLNLGLTMDVKANLSTSVGYAWEKFTISDYQNNGFAYVPSGATGSYLGPMFMGTLTKPYSVHWFYARVNYKF